MWRGKGARLPRAALGVQLGGDLEHSALQPDNGVGQRGELLLEPVGFVGLDRVEQAFGRWLAVANARGVAELVLERSRASSLVPSPRLGVTRARLFSAMLTAAILVAVLIACVLGDIAFLRALSRRKRGGSR